jgi:hypothetical protein
MFLNGRDLRRRDLPDRKRALALLARHFRGALLSSI